MRAAGEKASSPGKSGESVKVAGTARFIARNLLIASREPRCAALVPPGSEELHRRLLATAEEKWFLQAAQRQFFRAAFRAVVDWLLPGIVLHYLARKRCLEDWVRRETGHDGCRQVVVLGAGLDTLAGRLSHERPGVRFVEMDRRPALRIKEEALASAEAKPPNLGFLVADIGCEPLKRTLGQNSMFDPAAPTLFVAEGLCMYLPPARVESLLAEAAALGTEDGPNVFAFTFMEAREDGDIRFRRSHPLVRWWLRWQGEPFRWAISPDELPAFLARAGWWVRELVSADDLRARYLLPAGLRDAPLAVGEWLVLAETIAKS